MTLQVKGALSWQKPLIGASDRECVNRVRLVHA